ncbi:MAG: hypothetical protein ORN85_03325, partial [Sediminibacterium sp.]|nr:hypothetical protein [Sediminibacterium sp.]
YTTNSSTLTDMWNTTLSSSSIIFAPIKNIVVNAIFPIVKSIDVKSFNYLKANDSLILELIFNKKISSNKDTSNIWFTLKFDNNDSIILKSGLIGFQDKIQFFTQIPYRITALNGVIFGRILNSQTALYDSLGNPFNHSLINVNISKNIFVDGLAPYFLDSISTITICQTMRNLSLQKYLSINNVNKNQAHSIKLVQFPKYGTITGLNTIYYSTSNILNINANYQNLNQSNSGWDTVVFSVSDGYYISYKKILIRLLDSIVNNIIQSKQNLCVYDSNYIYGNTINIPQRNISYKWQVATSDTSDFYTLSGNQSSLLIGTYSNESQRWFRRLVSDSICSSVSNIVSVNFFNISLWTGKKDSLWQNSYNWCNNKVPTKSSTVFIPQEASFYPVIYKNAEVGVLKLENGASLINNGYLKITNEIIAENNSLDFTKGSLEFNGKGFQ